MPRKLTTEEFISKSKQVHGNKYDYSTTIYIISRKKVSIKCRSCGELFHQKANDHLAGKGCIKCSGKYRYSSDEFISKANKIHCHKYDYSKVHYINSHTKIKISCPKHGEFIQSPYHHLRGSECPQCLHKISKRECDFMDYLQISIRNFSLPKWKKKYVDGYDPHTNTIYEFLGDYWHGNPEVYDGNHTNPDTKLTFNTLLKRTFEKLNKMKSLGYNVKFIWENDWNKFKKGIHSVPQLYSIL